MPFIFLFSFVCWCARIEEDEHSGIFFSLSLSFSLLAVVLVTLYWTVTSFIHSFIRSFIHYHFIFPPWSWLSFISTVPIHMSSKYLFLFQCLSDSVIIWRRRLFKFLFFSFCLWFVLAVVCACVCVCSIVTVRNLTIIYTTIIIINTTWNVWVFCLFWTVYAYICPCACVVVYSCSLHFFCSCQEKEGKT